MNLLSPRNVLLQVMATLPKDRLKNVIVIGSLAVAYHYFKDDDEGEVRTKDVDCLLAPRGEMVQAGEEMTIRLCKAGWRHRKDGGFGEPQAGPEPHESLSAIRLYPPESEDWFIELLAVPDSESDTGKKWVPLRTDEGYFGLPSFEFLSLAAHRPIETEFGIRYARPAMMALANLLSHPMIGPETMSSKYEGKGFKRSNKDLGRVLAIARLDNDDGMAQWAGIMKEALRNCFPTRYPDLAKRAGSGFRELLDGDEDMKEAQHICNNSLLAGNRASLEELRATGRRFIQDVIEPLAQI